VSCYLDFSSEIKTIDILDSQKKKRKKERKKNGRLDILGKAVVLFA
jgi:hypothetical protein